MFEAIAEVSAAKLYATPCARCYVAIRTGWSGRQSVDRHTISIDAGQFWIDHLDRANLGAFVLDRAKDFTCSPIVAFMQRLLAACRLWNHGCRRYKDLATAWILHGKTGSNGSVARHQPNAPLNEHGHGEACCLWFQQHGNLSGSLVHGRQNGEKNTFEALFRWKHTLCNQHRSEAAAKPTSSIFL